MVSEIRPSSNLKNTIMSDAQFHSYRFKDETDPTDEQLAELMRQAAADAREKGRIANEKY